MVRDYPHTPIGDGHGFYFQVEISRAAVRLYHEMPLWNPFDCRGSPMWDHPENITASPAFFLTLPFKSAGPFVLVWHFAHVIVGFLGAWLLCRDDLRLSRAATFIAASAWAFGATHSQYSGGHFAFMSFYHAPLLLFAWRKAEHSWNWCVGTGLLLAWMVYDGATYPLPLTTLFLGIESCTRLTNVRRALHIAACAAVVGVVGLSIGASRILPLQAQFSAHNRVMEDDWDQLTNLKSWFQMYLVRSPAFLSRMPGQQYVFGEYQAYIGWLGFLLFLIGLGFMAAESTWLVVIMLVLVLLMLGHFSPRAPWSLLHAYVPPFKSMRVPSRFRLLLALPVALSMGYAVDRFPALVARLKPSWSRVLRVALIGIGGLAVGDNMGLLTELLEPRFQEAPPAEVTRSPRFYYGGALPPDIINMPRTNHAWLGCRTTWAYNTEAALWTGDVPQARAKAPEAAVVENVSRTHNTFTLDVDVKQPARILLNSGFDLGWRSNVGTIADEKTLLALDLPAGHHHVKMHYWPRRLTLGIWLSVAGLFGSLAFLLRRPLRGLVRRLVQGRGGGA